MGKAFLMATGRTLNWTYVFELNIRLGLAKLCLIFLPPICAIDINTITADMAAGVTLHIKHFIILTLFYAKTLNFQKVTSGERRLRECFALWSLCCQPYAAVIKLLLLECLSGQIFVISQTGFCGRPALLTRSLLLGRQTRRVVPRGSWSGSNHLSRNFSQPGIALSCL